MNRGLSAIRIVSFLAGLCYAAGAQGHAILTFPPPRPGSDAGNTSGPCGPYATASPTVLQAGSTVTITWDETIHHGGNFQFYFAPSTVTSQQNILPLGVPSPVPTSNLLYQVAQSFTNSNNLPHHYSAQLTLPNSPCTHCTLQMYQVNSDIVGGANYPTSPNNVVYYFSCADIQLTSAAASPTPSPSPSPSPSPTLASCAAPSTPATFTNVNSMIIQPMCISCHATATSANANFSFATYAGVLSAVNLANPTQSLIYQLTEEGPQGGGMPPSPNTALTPAQESLLLRWIQAGAPNH